MEPSTEENPGLIHSLKRLGGTVLGIAENRVELLLVEVEEERCRAVQALLLIMSLAVLALMTLMLGTLTVVMLCGPEHRPAVLVIFSLLYLLATLTVFWKLRRQLSQWQSFSSTLAELKKDRACLDKKN
jgi:uncharacterized membrane protein YqjE